MTLLATAWLTLYYQNAKVALQCSMENPVPPPQDTTTSPKAFADVDQTRIP